jgi:hypothetical protein
LISSCSFDIFAISALLGLIVMSRSCKALTGEGSDKHSFQEIGQIPLNHYPNLTLITTIQKICHNAVILMTLHWHNALSSSHQWKTESFQFGLLNTFIDGKWKIRRVKVKITFEYCLDEQNRP